MNYTMTIENKNGGYKRMNVTSTAMLEIRERINFMLDSIATPDELSGIELGLEELLEDYGYSFCWENK